MFSIARCGVVVKNIDFRAGGRGFELSLENSSSPGGEGKKKIVKKVGLSGRGRN